MQKYLIAHKDSSGMTLVEILVAMLILGILIIAVFPLITQSLQATNLSNKISSQLFGKQSEIEVVAVTKDGAYLEDGTFIPISYFPVIANGNVSWVPGNTVKRDDLVRFLATKEITSYDQYEIYEGYTEEEGTFTINDKSLNDSSKLEIIDQNNNSFTGTQLSAEIIPGDSMTFSLPTSHNRFTNKGSPYIIKTTTDGKEKTGILLVHLPRAIIVKNNGQLLITSSPAPLDWFKENGSSNWVELDSNIPNADTINKIISIGVSESESAFIAVGNNGGIYSWENNDTVVFKKENSSVDTDLNDIIVTDTGLFAVGKNGVILQSPDGKTWSKKTTSTKQNLNAITYIDNKFVVVGDNGVMLTSSSGSSWTQVLTSSYPAKGEQINSKDTIRYSDQGDYMKTDSNPVTGTNYTIFMVVKPSTTPTDVMLMSLGTANNSFLLRTNGINLAAETKSGNSTSSFNSTDSHLNLSTDAAIIACRVSGSNIELYKNGHKQDGTITSITPGSDIGMQLGSNPLTNYTTPIHFNGSIVDVMVFNSALSINRPNWNYNKKDYSLASEMDVVHKYLSVKYKISITSDINDLRRYYGKAELLNSRPILNTMDSGWRTNIRWPYGSNSDHPNYTMKPALWLDIWSHSSRPVVSTLVQDGTKVVEWKNTSFEGKYEYKNTTDNNHTLRLAADLKAVAGSDKTHFYAGGNHRNILFYNGTAVSQDTTKLNGQTGKAIQYRIDDMIYAHDRYIALLNDDLGSSSKYIATLDRPDNYTDVKITSSNNLNDIFHYTPSNTLLVVGDNGTIYYSDDGVSWTNKTLSGNLVAGCLR